MDVQMPEMDGFQATAAIREKEGATGERVPIVAMTAFAMKGDREKCLAAGMDAYVAKPIRPEELFEVVEGLTHGGDGRGAGALSTTDVFDRTEALAYAGGDAALLKEIAELFLADAPASMARLRQTMESRDAQALAEAAHALKGATKLLGASAAFHTGARLEEIGRSGDLAGAPEAWAAMEREMERFTRALSDLLHGGEVGARWSTTTRTPGT
jgi:CheY-like chemotaxis protein